MIDDMHNSDWYLYVVLVSAVLRAFPWFCRYAINSLLDTADCPAAGGLVFYKLSSACKIQGLLSMQCWAEQADMQLLLRKSTSHVLQA